jgi:hypothetical protein
MLIRRLYMVRFCNTKRQGCLGRKNFEVIARYMQYLFGAKRMIKVSDRKLVIYFYDNIFTRLAFTKGAVRMQHTAGGFPSGRICDMVQYTDIGR